MDDTPVTRYAQVDDSFIAYQVFGEGPIDVVYDPGWIGHVEAQWQYPALARFLQRLASFSRVICFDHRGHGLSDVVDLEEMTLEGWMHDLGTVMDAVGIERAAIVAGPEGGPMAILHAATHPDRTTALVLINTSAAMTRDDDNPAGMPPSAIAKSVEQWQRSYWDDASAEVMIGSIAADDEDRDQLRRLARFAMAPGRSKRIASITIASDVRHILPTVRVPTLVLHRSGNRYRRIAQGRYVADAITGARFVELAGKEHWPWSGDQDAVLDEIEEFITGVRPTTDIDRVLATVLFTDIVVSTQRVAELGDRRWRHVLDQHDALVDRELTRHRGRKINTTGDGVLATFDGPARAVHCARALHDAIGTLGLQIRSGVHTGEVELRGADVSGIAVHIGQRISSIAEPGEVLVSRTVTDLVAGSGLVFENRGEHQLKGIPQPWQLFAVADG